jgi:hypothetical protein
MAKSWSRHENDGAGTMQPGRGEELWAEPRCAARTDDENKERGTKFGDLRGLHTTILTGGMELPPDGHPKCLLSYLLNCFRMETGS